MASVFLIAAESYVRILFPIIFQDSDSFSVRSVSTTSSTIAPEVISIYQERMCYIADFLSVCCMIILFPSVVNSTFVLFSCSFVCRFPYFLITSLLWTVSSCSYCILSLPLKIAATSKTNLTFRQTLYIEIRSYPPT